jgi:hypothetical protein
MYDPALMPLTVEVIAAIGGALSNRNRTQLLQLKMNPAAALLADTVLVKRADSKTQ